MIVRASRSTVYSERQRPDLQKVIAWVTASLRFWVRGGIDGSYRNGSDASLGSWVCGSEVSYHAIRKLRMKMNG